MKHIIVLVFCIVSIFNIQAQDKPVVLATASMISDMADNIFGDKATIESIVPLGGDPHMFEPTPKSAQRINEVDLVLENGLTFEGWLVKLIENSGTKAKVVTVTEGVNTIKSLDYANSSDPHAWMNAANVIIYAENILKAAKELSPEHSDYFDENFQKYKAELEALDQYIIEQIKSIPEQNRILITSHDAFQYYGTKYGIQLESTMGTSTDADVQTSDRIALEKVIKEASVPAIFVESTVNPKLMETIAKDHGIIIGGKLYADSLGDKESGADTYIKMMKQNTDVIVSALKKERVELVEKTDEGFFDTMTIFIIGLVAVLLFALLMLRKKR